MPTADRVQSQINERIVRLIEFGLADDQLFPIRREQRNLVEITFETAPQVSIALKNRPYEDVYRSLVQERVFNIKMLDGALIQMMYAFSNDTLRRHRLAFFPAPHLNEFQNNPDVYLDDEVDGDVVARNRMPFPFRYDYDESISHNKAIVHPKSHLTLGQYKHCRIPVSAPVTPHWFIDFVLRNFYDTPNRSYATEIPIASDTFARSILAEERQAIHVTIPS